MHAQMIRYLERRPDMYSPKGADNVQTLLLLDEFARFGKLQMIADAMATLRSKKVNICLVLQSMAQLDKIYGEYDRRIIFDNCQYQATLQANDPETQRYLSELIGTTKVFRHSTGEHDDFYGDTTYSRQRSESREYIVFPHELSTLKDILLRTPYGFCRVEKLLPYKKESCDVDLRPPIHIKAEVIPREKAVGYPKFSLASNEAITFSQKPKECKDLPDRKEVKMLSFGERLAQANKKIAGHEHEMRL